MKDSPWVTYLGLPWAVLMCILTLTCPLKLGGFDVVPGRSCTRPAFVCNFQNGLWNG